MKHHAASSSCHNGLGGTMIDQYWPILTHVLVRIWHPHQREVEYWSHIVGERRGGWVERVGSLDGMCCVAREPTSISVADSLMTPQAPFEALGWVGFASLQRCFHPISLFCVCCLCCSSIHLMIHSTCTSMTVILSVEPRRYAERTRSDATLDRRG